MMSPDGFRLPDGPRDAHREAAAAMLRRLASAFPGAGLGIAGSVAMGTHGQKSDLDLVVVDSTFRREAQFATVSEGIRTAVVCLRPDFDDARARRWMLAAAGDVPIISIVRSAFIARDPVGSLAEMQRVVKRLEEERMEHREQLLSVRLQHAQSAMSGLRILGGGNREHLMLELFTAVVDGWYLRQGLSVRTRQDGDRVLHTIASRDAALFELLREALPISESSVAPLGRAFDHVFDPGAARASG